MVLLLVLMFIIPISQQTLILEKIETDLGYAEIKTDEIEIPSRFDIILHIINPMEILDVIDNLEKSIKLLDLGDNRNFAIEQINTVRNKMKTILPSRSKRALFNFGGTILKWIYGTMDNEDRQDIENHFGITDQNVHNTIQTVNQQIKINTNFNDTFQVIKNSIESDRIKILGKLNEIEKADKRFFSEALYLEQMFKLNLIRNHVENIQDNIASARSGIIHPNILTNYEINSYQIDFKKLANIRLGFAKCQNNSLVFAIKIQTEVKVVDKKLIVPVPNSNGVQIDQEMEYVIKVNNITYTYNEGKILQELKVSKNCILKNNCKMINVKYEEFIEIDNSIIIVNNVKLSKLNSTCDERITTLNGNYFISFYNCTIQINDKKYSNNVYKYIDKYVIPSTKNLTFVSNQLSFENILLNQIDNIQNIKELRYHKYTNYGLGSFTFILLVVLIFVLYLYCKKNKVRVKIINKIQENLETREGGVTSAPNIVPSERNTAGKSSTSEHCDDIERVKAKYAIR